MTPIVRSLLLVGMMGGMGRLCLAFSSLAVRRYARSSTDSNTKLQATWSDMKAVQEYKDFLDTGRQEIERLPDGPSVIVKPADGGDDELAEALVKMGMGDDVVLVPGQELPSSLRESNEYPIYITVPPTELKEFLESLPESFLERREDFVFISGGLKYGNTEDLLKKKGYCRDTMTQFLCSGIKFAKFRPQDQSINLGLDGYGEEKIAGECAACGKWSGAVAARLERNAIRCKVLFYREWRRLMWERNVYDAAFHLVGAVREERTTLADVALYYEKEVSDIMWSISGSLRGSLALTLTYGFEERLFGIAEATGGEQECALIPEMFPFLYGRFEFASEFMEYLCYAQDERGLLEGVDFFRFGAGNKKPIIRPGNLRADGVI